MAYVDELGVLCRWEYPIPGLKKSKALALTLKMDRAQLAALAEFFKHAALDPATIGIEFLVCDPSDELGPIRFFTYVQGQEIGKRPQ